jgi:hypothetical protein
LAPDNQARLIAKWNVANVPPEEVDDRKARLKARRRKAATDGLGGED